MSDLMRAADVNSPSELRGATVHPGLDPTSNLLTRLFRSFDGSLALRLWNGTTLNLGKGVAQASEPLITLVCHHPGFERSMVFGRDPLRLAQVYFQGDIDGEGDFFAALNLKNHLNAIRLPFGDRVGALLTAFRLLAPHDARPGARRHRRRFRGNAVKAHSRMENRAAISFYYDVSHECCRLRLDGERVYSGAYFTSPDESLDQAQRNKLEHICRKLRLRPGERLLDIGCGWGALTGALSRLMVVSEQYPNLRANRGFRDLSVQVEGTENRFTVARNPYIKTVQDYNVTLRSFPSNLTAMVMGYMEKPTFAVENEKKIAKPPSVGFDTAPAKPAGPGSGASK